MRPWYQRGMRASLVTLCLVSAAVAAGCGDKGSDTGTPTSAPAETGGDDTTGGGQSEGGSPTTTGVQGTGGMTEAMTSQGATGSPNDTDTTGSFLVPLDGEAGGVECNNFTQDCPEGQKCMPWAVSGNAWNATKCVDVKSDPGQPGDDCTVDGSAVSGLDSCDVGVMCWDVDPNTMQGVCVAMCGGTQDAPVCDSDHTCFVSNDGVLNLCLLDCDPLAQDCPGDDVCILNPQGAGAFSCVLDASGDEGQAFDPCEFINSCDKGLFCALSANATECDPGSDCCLPFCELGMPVMCPGAAQECLPWFEEGTAPPGLEMVGYCGLMT